MQTETLSILRDNNRTISDVAQHFGKSEAWVAGDYDAVDGGQDWAEWFHDDDVSPSEAERADYRDGFSFGLYAMEGLEEAAVAEGWEEVYALATVEAAYAAVACGGPLDDANIPW